MEENSLYKKIMKNKAFLPLGISLMIAIIYILYFLISPLFINNYSDEENIFEIDNNKLNVEEIQVVDSDENTNISQIKAANENDNNNQELNQENTFTLAYKGEFEEVNYKVKGGFEIYTKDGKNFLRINNLDIINGPDLRLTLSNKKSIKRGDDFKVIAPLKSNKGSFNVEIPKDINIDEYSHLQIHCYLFSKTFASAQISKI